MKQRHKVYENGFTLIELLVVLVILALIVIAVPASFRGGTQVWEKGDRHAELLQNGLIGLEQIGREIKQAKYFTVANISDMRFIKQDAAGDGIPVVFGKSGDPEYVQQNSVDLAGPIADNAGTGASALAFTYYMEDGVTQTTNLNLIRSVLIQINTIDSQGKTSDIPLSSQVHIRSLDIGGGGEGNLFDPEDEDPPGSGWPWDFAIFGGGGVLIDNVSSVTGNVGSNGTIELKNNVIIDGDVVHLGDLDLQNEARIEFVGDHGDLVDYIIPPSMTDFSGFGDALEAITEEDENGEVTLEPYREYIDPNFGNQAVLNLSSGVYYFESFTAGGGPNNGLTLNIDLSAGSRHIEIFVGGQIEIGQKFTMNVIGGAENVYFESQYIGEFLGDGPAIIIGRNAILRGTFYAIYNDIGTENGQDLDGVDLRGALYSGLGWVYVHNGSNLTYVPSTYLTNPSAFDD